MPYVWLWLLIAQLLLLLPNRWKVYLHCREGSTLSAHANACVMCIFRFSRLFFRPFKCYTMFTAEVYSCYHTMMVVLYQTMAPLRHCLCKPRADQYSCLPFFAARTLRAGGGTRNALLQRRFRSAISRNSFRVGPDVASGIKCKYNCARISRLYLASEFRTNPPHPKSLVNASPCDFEISRPGVCVRSRLENTFVLRIY